MTYKFSNLRHIKMPCTIVRNSTGGGNNGAQSTVKAANTFTGDVW